MQTAQKRAVAKADKPTKGAQKKVAATDNVKQPSKEESKENDPPKKRSKRRGRKAKVSAPGETENSDTQQKAKEPKKNKKVGLSPLYSNEQLNAKSEPLHQQSPDNTSASQKSELSRAKRRRIRKKRILEALGILSGNNVKASKTRKRKVNAEVSVTGNKLLECPLQGCCDATTPLSVSQDERANNCGDKKGRKTKQGTYIAPIGEVFVKGQDNAVPVVLLSTDDVPSSKENRPVKRKESELVSSNKQSVGTKAAREGLSGKENKHKEDAKSVGVSSDFKGGTKSSLLNKPKGESVEVAKCKSHCKGVSVHQRNGESAEQVDHSPVSSNLTELSNISRAEKPKSVEESAGKSTKESKQKGKSRGGVKSSGQPSECEGERKVNGEKLVRTAANQGLFETVIASGDSQKSASSSPKEKEDICVFSAGKQKAAGKPEDPCGERAEGNAASSKCNESKAQGDTPVENCDQTLPISPRSGLQSSLVNGLSDCTNVQSAAVLKTVEENKSSKPAEQKTKVKRDHKGESKSTKTSEQKIESKSHKTEHKLETKTSHTTEQKVETKSVQACENEVEPKPAQRVDQKICKKTEHKVDTALQPKLGSDTSHIPQLKADVKTAPECKFLDKSSKAQEDKTSAKSLDKAVTKLDKTPEVKAETKPLEPKLGKTNERPVKTKSGKALQQKINAVTNEQEESEKVKSPEQAVSKPLEQKPVKVEEGRAAKTTKTAEPREQLRCVNSNELLKEEAQCSKAPEQKVGNKSLKNTEEKVETSHPEAGEEGSLSKTPELKVKTKLTKTPEQKVEAVSPKTPEQKVEAVSPKTSEQKESKVSKTLDQKVEAVSSKKSEEKLEPKVSKTSEQKVEAVSPKTSEQKVGVSSKKSEEKVAAVSPKTPDQKVETVSSKKTEEKVEPKVSKTPEQKESKLSKTPDQKVEAVSSKKSEEKLEPKVSKTSEQKVEAVSPKTSEQKVGVSSKKSEEKVAAVSPKIPDQKVETVSSKKTEEKVEPKVSKTPEQKESKVSKTPDQKVEAVSSKKSEEKLEAVSPKTLDQKVETVSSKKTEEKVEPKVSKTSEQKVETVSSKKTEEKVEPKVSKTPEQKVETVSSKKTEEKVEPKVSKTPEQKVATVSSKKTEEKVEPKVSKTPEQKVETVSSKKTEEKVEPKVSKTPEQKVESKVSNTSDQKIEPKVPKAPEKKDSVSSKTPAQKVEAESSKKPESKEFKVSKTPEQKEPQVSEISERKVAAVSSKKSEEKVEPKVSKTSEEKVEPKVSKTSEEKVEPKVSKTSEQKESKVSKTPDQKVEAVSSKKSEEKVEAVSPKTPEQKVEVVSSKKSEAKVEPKVSKTSEEEVEPKVSKTFEEEVEPKVSKTPEQKESKVSKAPEPKVEAVSSKKPEQKESKLSKPPEQKVAAVSSKKPEEKVEPAVSKTPEERKEPKLPKTPEGEVEHKLPKTPDQKVEPKLPKTPEQKVETKLPKTPEQKVETKLPKTPEQKVETKLPKTPEQKVEPKVPKTPEQKVEPKVPKTPEQKVEPKVPKTPEQKVETKLPKTPEQKVEPKVPKTPEQKVEPKVPKTPEQKVEPKVPKTPEQKVETKLPKTPEQKVEPKVPKTPEQKVEPKIPKTPEQKVETKLPKTPEQKVEPKVPKTPEQKVEPKIPKTPEQKVETKLPKTPEQKVEPKVPKTPEQKVETKLPKTPEQKVEPKVPKTPEQKVETKLPKTPEQKVEPKLPKTPEQKVETKVSKTPEQKIKTVSPKTPEQKKSKVSKALEEKVEAVSLKTPEERLESLSLKAPVQDGGNKLSNAPDHSLAIPLKAAEVLAAVEECCAAQGDVSIRLKPVEAVSEQKIDLKTSKGGSKTAKTSKTPQKCQSELQKTSENLKAKSSKGKSPPSTELLAGSDSKSDVHGLLASTYNLTDKPVVKPNTDKKPDGTDGSVNREFEQSNGTVKSSSSSRESVRSSVLSDISLSAHCSEKEVKNFYNTYGTFPDRNTSSSAGRRVNSSSGDSNQSVNSVRDKVGKRVSSENTSSVADSVLEIKDGKFVNDNSAVEGCQLRSIFKAGGSFARTENIPFLKGPIYTSPNFENKVTSSVDSNQLFNSCRSSSVGVSVSSHVNKSADVSVSDSDNSDAPNGNALLPESPESVDNTIPRSDKGESRLLEIVENVLLVHEKVREQLTSERQELRVTPEREKQSPRDAGEKSGRKSKSTGEQRKPLSGSDICSNSIDVIEELQKKLKPAPTQASVPLVSEDSSEMQPAEKSREEVIKEREARKAAKLAKKNKGQSGGETKTPAAGVDGSTKASPSVSLPGESEKMKPSNAKASAVSVKLPTSKASTFDEVDRSPTVVPSLSKEIVGVVEKGQGEAVLGASSKAEAQAAKPEDQPAKSKAELRAERRAKQEAQRAAKASAQQQKAVVSAPADTQVKKAVPTQQVAPKTVKAPTKAPEPAKEVIKASAVPQHRVKLFSHLYLKQEASIPANVLNIPNLHPAIIRLGVQYASKVVVGSNARCLALLHAMKKVIEDYRTPPQKEFARGLEASLQPCTAFLQDCRPLSVSMTNALKHLKWQMNQLPNNISDVDARKRLQEAIDTYIREQIEVAGLAICNTVLKKISDGDVILTYGCSSLVQRILIQAHESGSKFRVVVVDGRPWREGKEMLRRLVKCGLKCSYVLISAASFIMREVSKVLLGAHALLANGYVMSRAGSSQVAMLAHSYNVPVLVCCETHKFSERVQTDSFVYNELGNPDELAVTDTCVKDKPLAKWKAITHLTPLNLTYDVTPPDLVTAVVTELAILPCTSVPVILRIKPTEIGF